MIPYLCALTWYLTGVAMLAYTARDARAELTITDGLIILVTGLAGPLHLVVWLVGTTRWGNRKLF